MSSKNKIYHHFTDKFGNVYQFENYLEFAQFWFNLSVKTQILYFPENRAKLQRAASSSKEARKKCTN